MPVTFQSQATGQLVMLQAHAEALLQLLGKTAKAPGILEVADDGESRGGSTQRQPVDDTENLARKYRKRIFPIGPVSIPAIADDQRQAIEQGATRSGQQNEPEQHGEDMPVRSGQRPLDGQAGNICRAEVVG